eukprot:5238280-Heterocapsa_arctica.AAC.1
MVYGLGSVLARCGACVWAWACCCQAAVERAAEGELAGDLSETESEPDDPRCQAANVRYHSLDPSAKNLTARA